MTKLSIKTLVLWAIVGLQVLAATLIISVSHISSERAVLGQSQQLMVESAEHTIRLTQNLLDPAETALSVTRSLFESDILEPHDRMTVERYFFEQLSATPELSGLYYGDAGGNFIFVSRSSEVEEAQYRTKIVSRSKEETGAMLVYRDASFEKVASRYDMSDTYDPRQRPWYENAMDADGVVWTDPYIFYSSGRPGITVATPVADADGSLAGVIGIDLEIATLSGFLSDLDITNNSAALILTANGDVIAHSDLPDIRMHLREDASRLRFIRIDDIGDPVTRAALHALDMKPGAVDFRDRHVTRFEVENNVYSAALMPMSVGNLDWSVAVYTPEVAILGEIISGRYKAIALAVGITLVAILIGWWVSHAIVRPMQSLSAFADRISQGETPDPHDLPRSPTEVERVSQAFRRLTRWLDAYRARNDALSRQQLQWSRELEVRVEERTVAIREANAQLRQEITERAEAERRLAVEIDKHRTTSANLERSLRDTHEASQAKSRFLSSMSHELRTPLNAIIGFGQMLRGHGGRIGDEKKAEYAGYILTSGERLLTLINEVLDLAQIESGRTLLSIGSVDPAIVIDRVIAETGIIAEKRGITLIDETAGIDLPEVRADHARMTQCLINLVANAIKYNRDGGSVTISARHDAGAMRIAVTDTGYGIADDYHAQVFETFNRLGAEHGEVEGNGVGLSLTKEYIEKMGGSVGFESVKDVGSTFWFDLPCKGWGSSEDTGAPAEAAQMRA